MGVVAEGVFNVTTDTIEVIAAPGTTLDMLKELEEIIRRAQRGTIDPDDAVRRAEEILPKLGALVRATHGRPDYLNYLLTLIGIAIALWGMHDGNRFQEELLDRQSQMITSLNEVAERIAGPVQDKGKNKATKEAEDISVSPRVGKKAHPRRRALVNAKRRTDLKAYREAFGGSALLHNYRHRP